MGSRMRKKAWGQQINVKDEWRYGEVRVWIISLRVHNLGPVLRYRGNSAFELLVRDDYHGFNESLFTPLELFRQCSWTLLACSVFLAGIWLEEQCMSVRNATYLDPSNITGSASYVVLSVRLLSLGWESPILNCIRIWWLTTLCFLASSDSASNYTNPLDPCGTVRSPCHANLYQPLSPQYRILPHLSYAN